MIMRGRCLRRRSRHGEGRDRRLSAILMFAEKSGGFIEFMPRRSLRDFDDGMPIISAVRPTSAADCPTPS